MRKIKYQYTRAHLDHSDGERDTWPVRVVCNYDGTYTIEARFTLMTVYLHHMFADVYLLAFPYFKRACVVSLDNASRVDLRAACDFSHVCTDVDMATVYAGLQLIAKTIQNTPLEPQQEEIVCP